MSEITIRRGRKSDAEGFVGLVKGLARFEKLRPPSSSGTKRLLHAIFEEGRVRLLVAEKGTELAGYALYFYTYSSFLAKPTLYLEDIFVLQQYRKQGVGSALFRRCVDEAISNGCGRMEWAVLTWNRKAIAFYERLGARRLSDWYVYRMDRRALQGVQRVKRK